MYFYPNPFFYQYQPQLYLLPPILQLDVSQPSLLEHNYIDSPLEQKTSSLKVQINFTQNNDQTILSKHLEVKPINSPIDSDYEPEQNEIMILYKKKNTESNLSNQIYSYISSQKSIDIMLKIFEGNSKKVQELYKLLTKIKRSNKKYMNRSYIDEMVQMKEGSTNFKIYLRCKCPLKAEQIRKAIRISIKYFISNICDLGLLTSRKMNKLTLVQHFVRKREIMQFLFQDVAQKK